MRRFTLLVLFAFSPAFSQTLLKLVPNSLATISDYESTAIAPPFAAVYLRPVGSSAVTVARVVSVSSQAITFLVPPDAKPGRVQVTYRRPGADTKWFEGEVVAPEFRISAVQVLDAQGTTRGNLLARPAMAGEVIVVWGSGLRTAPLPKATIAGIAQEVLYAGRSESMTGVDQINVRVHANTPNGCVLPLEIEGQAAQRIFVSKSADGSACPNELGVTPEELKKMDDGASIPTYEINLASNISVASIEHASRTESAAFTSGSFSRTRLENLLAPGDTAQCGTLSSFFISDLLGFFTVAPAPRVEVSGDRFALTLAQDNRYSASLPVNDSPLSQLPLPAFTGSVLIRADEREGSFPLPSPVTFADRPVGLARDRDLALRWSAGADAGAIATITIENQSLPIGNGFASFLIQSSALTIESSALTIPSFLLIRGRGISCTAPANTGNITIPKELLATLSPSTATLSIRIAQKPNPAWRLSAPRPDSPRLLLVNMSSSDTRAVDIQ